MTKFVAEVIQDATAPNDWRVEKINNDGSVDVAIFSGPDARVRAIEYTSWKYDDSTPDSEREEPRARRPGFDVGAGSVKEGDTALFEGRECKVLTVYHDGDVQIEVHTYPTVKWRYVTPLPTPPSQEQKP